MLKRTNPTQRYARGLAAAVIAVATLLLAANAGPARAADKGQVQQVHQPSVNQGQNFAVSSSNPKGAGSGTVRPSLHLGAWV